LLPLEKLTGCAVVGRQQRQAHFQLHRASGTPCAHYLPSAASSGHGGK